MGAQVQAFPAFPYATCEMWMGPWRGVEQSRRCGNFLKKLRCLKERERIKEPHGHRAIQTDGRPKHFRVCYIFYIIYSLQLNKMIF
jgi:hypothetical protein